MRALVSVVLVCSIIALLFVAGCTFNLQKADGTWNKSFSTNPGTGTGSSNSGSIGGGTGGGKSGVSPAQGTYPQGSKYSRFQLNYYYRDITKYPQFNNHQACGECDAVVSEAKSDEHHDELLIDGIIGGMASPDLYDPHSDLEVSPFLSPRMSFSGKNYQREYDWMENYAPSNAEKAGCQGRGANYKSGYEYETITQGECNHIQVRITGIDDEQLEVTIQHAADGSECKSDETYTKHYKGTSMPDSVRKDTRDTSGEYNVVCAPYQKGVVQSDETEEYFFGKGPGEQTTRDFSIDSNGVYHIVCSGSKDEVLEPACPDNCDRRSCWPGAAATRHRERFLEIIISPADKPVTLMPRVTETLVSLAPLVPKK
jgi:hypothetical protein